MLWYKYLLYCSILYCSIYYIIYCSTLQYLQLLTMYNFSIYYSSYHSVFTDCGDHYVVFTLVLLTLL